MCVPSGWLILQERFRHGPRGEAEARTEAKRAKPSLEPLSFLFSQPVPPCRNLEARNGAAVGFLVPGRSVVGPSERSHAAPRRTYMTPSSSLLLLLLLLLLLHLILLYSPFSHSLPPYRQTNALQGSSKNGHHALSKRSRCHGSKQDDETQS